MQFDQNKIVFGCTNYLKYNFPNTRESEVLPVPLFFCGIQPVVLHHVSPLNTELNPICHLLALLGGATIVVISRLRVKS